MTTPSVTHCRHNAHSGLPRASRLAELRRVRRRSLSASDEWLLDAYDADGTPLALIVTHTGVALGDPFHLPTPAGVEHALDDLVSDESLSSWTPERAHRLVHDFFASDAEIAVELAAVAAPAGCTFAA